MWYIKITKKTPYKLECKVDSKIFNDKIVLKAMYELVDKVYMFIETTKNGNYKVFFKLKSGVEEKIDHIVDTFGEELVYHKLRSDLDKKTWKLKEKIISTALGFWLTYNDIKEDIEEITNKLTQLQNIDYNINGSEGYSECNFKEKEKNKSIDDIIAEIKNDPDFEEDKDEIISILKEIEEDDK